MRYSTMVRCIGERNHLDNYFAFMDVLKKSEIPGANLSFSEIQDLLDDDFDSCLPYNYCMYRNKMINLYKTILYKKGNHKL